MRPTGQSPDHTVDFPVDCFGPVGPRNDILMSAPILPFPVLMRARLLLLALLLAPAVAHAQQSAEQKEVLAVLDRFFEAMTSRDTAASRAVLLPGANFYIAVEGAKPTTAQSSDTAYIRSLGTAKAVLRERIWNPTVLVQPSIAQVWTPYDFHVDGKFSHCGTDVFVFLRTSTGWRMATAAYTIQRDGCAPSPLGALQ